jgi:hypothetical protein
VEQFEAVLRRDPDGGCWVEVPFDVRAVFGEARPPVRGAVDGAPFRGRIAVFDGRPVLGIRREVREAAGITGGDRVVVELERDDAPRDVPVPPDLAAALAEAGLRGRFDSLPFTHRREHVEAIEEARRPETRAQRIDRCLAALRAPG